MAGDSVDPVAEAVAEVLAMVRDEDEDWAGPGYSQRTRGEWS